MNTWTVQKANNRFRVLYNGEFKMSFPHDWMATMYIVKHSKPGDVRDGYGMNAE